MHENEISSVIIETAIVLHKTIGPGLLESVYKNSLSYDLKEKGLNVDIEVPVPFIYKDVKQDIGFRLDILVEKKVIIELKHRKFWLR